MTMYNLDWLEDCNDCIQFELAGGLQRLCKVFLPYCLYACVYMGVGGGGGYGIPWLVFYQRDFPYFNRYL